MTTELNLDAKQQEQIKPIIAEQNAKRAAMQAERMANRDKQKKMTSEDREAFMKNRKEEKEAMDNKLKTILSPEQFKKMKENEEANRAKMRESRESREPRDNGEPRDNNDMQ
jgi:Spy/CpxP family protein refolding chaperone